MNENKYQLYILPIARLDLIGINDYILTVLNNPSAAEKFLRKFLSATEDICMFPYGAPIYNMCEETKYEYRSYRVNNFLIFYVIDDNNKSITIMRIVYMRRNIEIILK